ncbi:component of the polarisome, partial [Ceratobasidium sp. 392]
MIENETTRVLDCYLTIDDTSTDSGAGNSTAYSGLVAPGITTLTNYRLSNDYCGWYQADAFSIPRASGPALPTTDPHAIVRTHYEELERSLQGHAESPNARANTLEKIARLTRQQFQELSTDVYDELVRRNNEKDGSKTSFLPIRDDFHAKRNEARRKLSTLPYDRLKHLLSDVFYELGRRYPEFKRSQTLSAVPDTPLSDLGIPTPELAGGCPPAAVSPSLQLSAPHQATTEVHTPRQTSVSQTSPVDLIINVSNHKVGEPSQSTPSAPSLETTVRISRTMTSVEIMRQLTLFGCQDITSDLLLAKCGRRPLAGGGFGDVYQGQLSGGTHVAIKCVRMFGSLDDEEMHQT